MTRCRQVAGFAGFLALRVLALTALRGVAGRITVGRPAGPAAASLGSGSGLKYARQGGESWDFLGDHAGRHAVDIGNLGAAEPERIAGAGLLLFGGVGLAGGRPRSKPTARWPAANPN